MLIDARMPACYWPWAIEHACFITNRLYCLRTKSVPVIDFLQGLRQPHPETIDFSNLPRSGCRAYKLINPRPGKFDPRAEMGWFIGFQKNTNKNFSIYHPHWTAAQGWKWRESFTPHATFNEDVVFGDELNSIDRQQTSSYWANHRSIFSEPVQSYYQQTSDEPPQRTQGQNTSQHDPPTTPDIPTPEIFNSDPSELNNQREDTPAPTSPHFINNSPLTPHEGSSVTQYHPVSDATSDHTSQDSDLQIIPYSRPYEDPREIIAADELSENDYSSEDEHFDQIMTGWDPVPQTAGTKRPHSPDHDTMITQRG
ncbi:hypothetical protein K3495_g10472 [Podosphaera aphanis]|nr:hypothetical protein K3495_g10472 [Podosphaera aphanis]